MHVHTNLHKSFSILYVGKCTYIGRCIHIYIDSREKSGGRGSEGGKVWAYGNQ